MLFNMNRPHLNQHFYQTVVTTPFRVTTLSAIKTRHRTSQTNIGNTCLYLSHWPFLYCLCIACIILRIRSEKQWDYTDSRTSHGLKLSLNLHIAIGNGTFSRGQALSFENRRTIRATLSSTYFCISVRSALPQKSNRLTLTASLAGINPLASDSIEFISIDVTSHMWLCGKWRYFRCFYGTLIVYYEY